MMDMKGFARDYLARAKERIMDASSALSRKSYPEVIRYSQEATELSLKASLRFVGVEYPKVHDVGDVLTACREKFPPWFASEVPAMSKFSRVMAEKRSAALYGVEASGKTPGEIFNDPEEAEEALKEARRIHELSRRMIL